jgi:putative peptidoglycan lipid II flippase
LRDWVKMSLPLMLGVTVVFMDSIVLTWFAKHTAGDITRLMYAKRLFTAPMAIVGQAAGAASFPFFASLYSRGMFQDYAGAVNRAVSRILAVSLMLSAAMMALARPAVDLVIRGGSFHREDSDATALYFTVFSISLALWATQSIYARAFFAAGETRAPMIAGTAITVISLPGYWLLHRGFGAMGLAWASNLAILIQTVALAVLAHRRYLVPLFGEYGRLDVREIAKAFAAAVAGYAGLRAMLALTPAASTHLGDLAVLVGGGVVWGGICFGVLRALGSGLIAGLLRR